MLSHTTRGKQVITVSTLAGLTLAVGACGPTFQRLRYEGQQAFRQGNLAVAKDRFEQAHLQRPNDPHNLLDLGEVSMIRARNLMAEHNEAAALREVDRAIAYFDRAVEARPGMQAALDARNEALHYKGLHDKALFSAEWAMTFVGPSARAQMFVARELEERGDMDGALLRYRQAVAMEPENAAAHASFGQFLHRIGRKNEAIMHLEQAYRLDPLQPGVAELLTAEGVPLPRTTEPLRP